MASPAASHLATAARHALAAPPADTAMHLVNVSAAARMAQLHAGGPTGLLLPSQDSWMPRIVNRTRDWADEGALPLPAWVVQTTALADGSAWAGLLADGRVLLPDPKP